MRALLVLAVSVLAFAYYFAWSNREPKPRGASEAESAERTESGLELTDAQTVSARVGLAIVDPALPNAALVTACTLVLRAVDERGEPVREAAVDWFVLGSGVSGPSSGRTRADVAGRVVIALPYVIPAAARVKLSVLAPPFHVRSERTIPSADEERTRAWHAGENDIGDCVLPRCGTLRGRIVDEVGTPVVGTSFVELLPSHEGRRTGSTNARGEFALLEIPPGRYTLHVRSTGYLERSTEPLDVRGGEETDVALVALTPAPTIRGVVVDVEGVPVAGVRVEARASVADSVPTAKTQDNGTFQLFLDEPSSVVLSVTGSPDFVKWGGEALPAFTFAPGAKEVRIVLASHPKFRFHVVDLDTSAPIERFGFTLMPSESRGDDDWGSPRNEPIAEHAQGMVAVALGGAGTIEVHAPNFTSTEFTIRADIPGADFQTLRLARGATISGRAIVDGVPWTAGRARLRPGKPLVALDGAILELPQSSLVTSGSSTRIDSLYKDGQFSFGELEAGTYALELSGFGIAARHVPSILVKRGEALVLGDISVERTTTVSGVFSTSPGDSPIGFRVRLGFLGEKRVNAADGRFQFTDVPAGTHLLSWRRANGVVERLDSIRRTSNVTVAAGETRQVVIDALNSEPCSLTIRVMRTGTALAGVELYECSDPALNDGYTRLLGLTNEFGAVSLLHESDVASNIRVVDREGRVLGRTPRPIALVPAGHVEEVIAIEAGRLVLELPQALARTAVDEISLHFADLSQPDLCARRQPSPDEDSDSDCIAWTSNALDFGEFAAGTYDITVQFRHFGSKGPDSMGTVTTHPSFQARITIVSGATTRVVVP